MTPVAKMIVEDSVRTLRRRRYPGAMETLRLDKETHFFDCSALLPIINDLSRDVLESFDGGGGMLAFLPAPRTFIEWIDADGQPNFALIESLADDQEANVTFGGITKDHRMRLLKDALRMPLRVSTSIPLIHRNALIPAALAQILYGFLACINSPSIFLRSAHNPDKALQSRLLRHRGMVGKFPLRGWTEIKLEVMPKAMAEAKARTGLTGERALHFVRAHMSRRHGVWTEIASCWRGDPSLGIKRSRYAVVPA